MVDKTDKIKGGASHKDLLVKIKMLFLQYLYNISDPELENQVNDRLSFQKFVGLNFITTIPDYTTIWRFRERLIQYNLSDKLFVKMLKYLEDHKLIIRRGTIVDATIIESSNRPLSDKRRKELADNSSSQIDTDSTSTKKRGRYYFGYKGHIDIDIGSKIIRKRVFSTAKHHDSKYQEGKNCQIVRKKRDKKRSRICSSVEHPFAFIKTKLNYVKAVANSMDCILYNIFRANYLIDKITY